MLLKVSTGDKTWAMFRLSDHISFGKGDTRFGWCSFPEDSDLPKEEFGICVNHEGLNAWIPYGGDGYWLRMIGEPSMEDYVVVDGDGNHKIKTKVRLMKWLVDEDAERLFLFDGWAYILNDDGKTIERL